MKKLVLLLVISLGLSVANAESVCETKAESYCDDAGSWVAHSLAGRYVYKRHCNIEWCDNEWRNRYDEDEKLRADWKRTFNRCYIAEIKRRDKESVCLYMNRAITDYLKTTLTPQEIERFERYLVKNKEYESYESNKDFYLNALKVLKYFDKLEYWLKDDGGINDFAWQVKKLTDYNDYPKVYVKRFVYEEDLGDDFTFQSVYTNYSLNTMKKYVKSFEESGCENAGYYKEDCHKIKDLKYIIKWAESKINESKQKESK